MGRGFLSPLASFFPESRLAQLRLLLDPCRASGMAPPLDQFKKKLKMKHITTLPGCPFPSSWAFKNMRTEILYFAGLTNPVGCSDCDGAGMWMVCYGGTPSEQTCKFCSGYAMVDGD